MTEPKSYDEYLQHMTIPRDIEVPPLSDKQIEDITKTVFIPLQIQAADILFIFGSSLLPDAIGPAILHGYRQGFFPIVNTK